MSSVPPPEPHPYWCDRDHSDDWPVHSAAVGEVQLGERHTFTVDVNRWRAEAAPVVTLTQVSGTNSTVIDLSTDHAAALAGLLRWAVNLLGGDQS